MQLKRNSAHSMHDFQENKNVAVYHYYWIWICRNTYPQEFVAAKLTVNEISWNVWKEIKNNDDDQEDNKSKFIEKTPTNAKVRNALKF